MNFSAAINTFFIWQKMDLKFLEPINNLNIYNVTARQLYFGSKIRELNLAYFTAHKTIIANKYEDYKIYICACKFTTDIKTNT